MRSNYQEITEFNIKQLGIDTKSRKSQVNIYSDSTHFIFEILQNADDYGATEIAFILKENQLTIIHNGTPFNDENVRAVTYFGASTSEPDLVKTGRFGIGFKSVFTFTASPIIISGNESFRIFDLYKIEEYKHSGVKAEENTHIILPFNHLELKPDYVEELLSSKQAYDKIEAKLHSLDMLSLLFTKNLKVIKWKTKSKDGEYKRTDNHSGNYRTSTISASNINKSFIVFSKPIVWESKNYKPVEIAFHMNKNPDFIPFSSSLFVLFPTILDTHLKFIINGPFRTKPSRESISYDDRFNQNIIQLACELFEIILTTFKKEHLIKDTFLNILPLPNDNVNDFFLPIQNTINKNFKFESYIPTVENSYNNISNIRFVTPKILSKFFTKEDISVLQSHQNIELLPSISKNSRAYEFLHNLGLKEWSWSELESDLNNIFDQKVYLDDINELNKMSYKWLVSKDDTWLLSFYELLAYGIDQNKLGDEHFDYNTYKSYIQLDSIFVIKCKLHDSLYFDQAPSVKFPKEGYTGVLYDGFLDKSKDNYDVTVRVFKSLGVKEINEEDEIKIILNNHYYSVWSSDSKPKIEIKDHMRHMKLFLKFYKKNTDTTIFQNYKIFLSESHHFTSGSLLYIDHAFCSSGLNQLYISDIKLDRNKNLLWEGYKDIYNDSFLKFIEMMDVEVSLKIVNHPVQYNPRWNELKDGMYGNDGSQYKVEEDFSILNLKSILNSKNIDLVKLLWLKMNSLDPKYYTAKYTINSKYQIRKVPSFLLHQLSTSSWIPDVGLNFCSPSDISYDTLHTDLKLDSNDNTWLELIGFGKNTKLKSEIEAERIKSLNHFGFKSLDEYDDWMLLKEKLGDRPLSSLLQYIPENQVLPQKSVNETPERKSNIKQEFHSSKEITYTESQRHLRDSKNSVKPLIKNYLRSQYTNSIGILICQICHFSMPFKLDNQYYFESVEIFSENYLGKESDKPYLALCPNCAAKYKHLIRPHHHCLEDLKGAIKEMTEDEKHYIKIKHENTEVDIYFTKMHIADLKVILDEIE